MIWELGNLLPQTLPLNRGLADYILVHISNKNVGQKSTFPSQLGSLQTVCLLPNELESCAP